MAKQAAATLDCHVISTLNGDFLSPCTLTAIDGGQGMMQALNVMGIDIVCLGNHEFDLGFQPLADKLNTFSGTVLNSNVLNPELTHFPRMHTFSVGERLGVMGGFSTEDLSCYRPASRPQVSSINEGCVSVWEEAKAEAGRTPHLFLPITHQLIAEDRLTCGAIAKHDELRTRTPIVLGGHEHDVYIDEAGRSLVVKTGQDAERLAVIDIWWDSQGELHSSVALVPSCVFPAHKKTQAYVDGQTALLEAKQPQ
ncbi:MAG: hypothetical protein SGPRY_012290 [Prymnesium sp.]